MRVRRGEILAWACILWLLLVGLVQMAGVVLPVYSDEVTTKWLQARFFEEGGRVDSLFPQCVPGEARVLQPLFVPAAIAYSLVYSSLGPLGLRLSGVAGGLAWFAGLAWLCLRFAPDRRSGLVAAVALTALALLGVMPWLWVFSRPEQNMLLLLLALSLACVFAKPPRSAAGGAVRALLMFLAVSCFLYAHPKTVFFVPFLLVVAWFLSAGASLALRALAIALVAGLAWIGYTNAAEVMRCEADPAVRAILAGNAMTPAQLLENPVESLAHGISNLIQTPRRVIRHLLFQPSYQSGWLPGTSNVGAFVPWLNTAVAFWLQALVIGSHIGAIAVLAFRLVKGGARAPVSAPVILAALLAVANLGNAFFYEVWHFYGAIQVVGISLLIVALLCLPGQGVFAIVQQHPRIVLGALAMVVATGIASLCLLVVTYLPSLARNARSPDAVIAAQPLSIPSLATSAHLASIETLAAHCGLREDGATRIVVDHMTYFSLKRSTRPIHVLYISELGFGAGKPEGWLPDFLQEIGSPGVLARCEWLPRLDAALVRGERGYCCARLP